MKISFLIVLLLSTLPSFAKVIEPGSSDAGAPGVKLPDIPSLQINNGGNAFDSISSYAESYFDKKIVQRPKTEVNQYLGDLITTFSIPLPRSFQSINSLVFKYNSSQFLNVGYGIGFSLELPRIDFVQDEVRISGSAISGLLIQTDNPQVANSRIQKILTTLKLTDPAITYFLNQSGEDSSLYLKIANQNKVAYAQIKTDGESWIFNREGNPTHVFGIKNRGLTLHYLNNHLAFIKDLDSLWAAKIDYLINEKETQIHKGTLQTKTMGVKSITLIQGSRHIRYDFNYTGEYLTKVSEKNSFKTLFQGEYGNVAEKNFKIIQQRNDIDYQSASTLTYSADLKNLNWLKTVENESAFFVDLNGDFYQDKIILNTAELIASTNKILKKHKIECDEITNLCKAPLTKEELERQLNELPQTISTHIAMNESGALTYKKDSTLSLNVNEVKFAKFEVTSEKRKYNGWDLIELRPEIKMIAVPKIIDIDGNGKKDLLICDYDDSLKKYDISLSGIFSGSKQNPTAISYYNFLKNKSDDVFKENGKVLSSYMVYADKSILQKYSKDLQEGKFHFVLNSSKLTQVKVNSDLACNQLSIPIDYNNDGYTDLLTGNKVTLINAEGAGKTIALTSEQLRTLFNMPAEDLSLSASPIELLDLKNDGKLSFISSFATYIDRQDRTLVYLQNGMKFKVQRPSPVKLLIKENVTYGGYSQVEYIYHNGSVLVRAILYSPIPSNIKENTNFSSQINKQPQFKKVYEYGGSRFSDQFNILLGHVSSNESIYLIDPTSNQSKLSRKMISTFDTDFQNGPLFYVTKARKNGRILKTETFGRDGVLLSKTSNQYAEKSDLGTDRLFSYLRFQSNYTLGSGEHEIQTTNELTSALKNIGFLGNSATTATSVDSLTTLNTYHFMADQFLVLPRVTTVTDSQSKNLKLPTIYSYNHLGELTELQSEGIKRFFEYDSNGRIVSDSDQRGKLATYNYHLSTPLISSIKEDGVSQTYDYEFVTNYVRESSKNNSIFNKFKWSTDNVLLSLDRVTDNQLVNIYLLKKNGLSFDLNMADVSKTYFIDGFGRVIEIHKNIGDQVIIEKKEVYNDQDLPINSTLPHFLNERMNLRINAEYDGLNRQVREVLSGTVNDYSVNFEKLTSRNSSGETLISEVLKEGIIKQSKFVQNERGHTISHATPSEIATFNLDPLGNILGVKEIQAEYSYDLHGRLVSTQSSKLPWGTMSQAYSAVANKTVMISGETTSDAYNRIIHLKNSSLTSSFERSTEFEKGLPQQIVMKLDDLKMASLNKYDEGFKLLSKSIGGLAIDYKYDNFDRVASENIHSQANNNKLNYGYSFGQLSSISPIVSSIEYDANNNPTLIEFNNNVTINFQYDVLKKLESVQMDLNNSKSFSIQYNVSTNGKMAKIYSDVSYIGLRQKNKIFHYTKELQLNKAPRLNSTNKNVSFNQSNLEKLNDFNFTYENDLLVKISHPKYGAFKNFVAPDKSWQATCNENFNDKNDCFIKLSNDEYSVSGSYVRSIRISGKIVAILYEGEIYPALTDHLGSVIALVSSKGDSLAFEREYDEWGEKVSVHGDKNLEKKIPWAYAGLVQHPFFNGELLQSETRIYIPSLGLWNSADNLVKWNPNKLNNLPGNWNPLMYSSGDPINNVDPTGHLTFSINAGFAAGIAEDPSKSGGKYLEKSLGITAGNTEKGFGVIGTSVEARSTNIIGFNAGVGFSGSLSSGKVEDVKGPGTNTTYTFTVFSLGFGYDSEGSWKDLSFGFGGKGFGLSEVIVESMTSVTKLLEIDSKNKFYTREID